MAPPLAQPPPAFAPEKVVWAYTYQIDPSRPTARLTKLRRLLEQEQAWARVHARTWEARVVLDSRVTHILIVSDSPAQDLDINLRVEAELRHLNVGFSLTIPLAVPGSPAFPREDADSMS